MPLVYGPLFNDEYSMQFDGTDDYISVGRDVVNFGFTDPFSVSLWFKPDYLPGHATFISKLLNQGTYPAGGVRGWTIFYNNSINFQLHGSNWTESENLQSVTNVYNNLRYYWHHLVLTYSGTRGVGSLKMYLDGFDVSGAATSIGSGGALSSSATTIIGDSDTISGVGNSSTPFPGNLDEIAIFDYTLTQSEVGVLYNGIGPTGGGTTAPWNDGTGKPNNVGNLPQPPIKWYRMGENGTFKYPQWLLPENSNKDKVNNYSMSFDGTDGYVRLGPVTPPTPLGLTPIMSISIWAKMTGTFAGHKALFTNDQSGGPLRNWTLILVYNQLTFQLFNTNGDFNVVTDPGVSRIQDGNWHHVMATYDGTTDADGMKLWVDGSVVQTQTTTSTGIRNSAASPFIGGAGWNGLSWNWDGYLDEVSTWLEVKVPDDVSDNNIPIDLTGKSNLVGWWKMGDMAYSAGTADIWVVPDSSTNNNTGFAENQDIEDRVGDAPDSSGNTISYNMEINDRVNDTPG